MRTDALGRGAASRCDFDLSVRIDRPPALVHAFLADVQDAEPVPRRATVRMTKDPSGPTTVGTRWHERVRIAPGAWLRIESITTEVDAPRRLGMDFRTLWFTGHLTYDIEPVDGGSLLHQRETLRPRLALRPLAGWIGRQLGPRLHQRLDDIRRLLESDSGRPGPHTST